MAEARTESGIDRLTLATFSRELRHLARPVEVRAQGNGEATMLAGYAALFETPAEIAGAFVEVIDRGAFDAALADDVRVLFNHDPSQLLGRTKSGTARIAVDHHGLRYEVTPPATTTGRDVIQLVERGDVDGSSFGFQVIADRWVEGATPDDLPVRHLESVRLFDVSPVTQPAYAETTVEARQMADEIVGSRTRDREPAGDVPLVDAEQEIARRRLRLARHQVELRRV